MFHRLAEADGQIPAEGIDCPIIPDKLRWPLPALLGDSGGSGGGGGPAETVDRATRLSRAGAVTWWHLDDCGEFVFQVGLPVRITTPTPARGALASSAARKSHLRFRP